eukprot:1158314-Pelagomonas_calceolata.AAC.13
MNAVLTEELSTHNANRPTFLEAGAVEAGKAAAAMAVALGIVVALAVDAGELAATAVGRVQPEHGRKCWAHSMLLVATCSRTCCWPGVAAVGLGVLWCET